jgi:hypothetical protein
VVLIKSFTLDMKGSSLYGSGAVYDDVVVELLVEGFESIMLGRPTEPFWSDLLLPPLRRLLLDFMLLLSLLLLLLFSADVAADDDATTTNVDRAE